MIKNHIINAGLGLALARARHKDAIVICDANMPIPPGCAEIDLSLVRGVPTPVPFCPPNFTDFQVCRLYIVKTKKSPEPGGSRDLLID